MADPTDTKPPAEADGDDDFLTSALEDYRHAYERERENINQAYEDQKFRAGEHWTDIDRAAREEQGRPCLTVNHMPQFIRQVTGDIRQGRPSIKVVATGSSDTSDKDATEEAAKLRAGMIRYIENRCDAQCVYFEAADSQVAAGIGHFRVKSEYASESTFEQEIGLELIEDGIAVLWDPDATDPTRKDAMFCFVPVDMSRRAHDRKYPKSSGSQLDDTDHKFFEDWYGEDYIRVAEYWFKKPSTIKLALTATGDVVELDDADEERLADLAAMGARIEERESFQVWRAVISATDILEAPKRWDGRYIPIIPMIGEEVRIGRKVVRHGIVRFARDPQRMFNYGCSAQSEVVALQPKAPWIGTEKQFECYRDAWETSNSIAHPVLMYTPDPSAPMPSRVAPPVSSSGVTEMLELAAQNMMTVTGIQKAGLGQESNEKSGKAIVARQRESDTGTFVYLDNFTRSVRHAGTVVLDLIPHVYDTQRTIRIIHEDGKSEPKTVNQPIGVVDQGEGEDGYQEALAALPKLNDLSIGAYDVVVEEGPSYATKREEAKDGMSDLIQSVPQVFGLIGDLYVKAQDWPMADQIAKRLEMTLPPQIKQQMAQDSGEPPQPQPPQPPSPADQLAAGKLQVEHAKLGVDMAKVQAELQKAGSELQQAKLDAVSKIAGAHADIVGSHADVMTAQPDPRVDQIAQAVAQLQQVVQQMAQGMQPQVLPLQPQQQDQDQAPSGAFFNGASPAQ